MQEQAQAICKVLSTAFDSVLSSEKPWISTAALHTREAALRAMPAATGLKTSILELMGILIS